MKIDSNIKMRCRGCEDYTKGAECSWCLRGLTACAACGYCHGCDSTPEQRSGSEEEW